MKNLIMITVLATISIVTAPVFASEIEDYAGLSLYEEDVIASSQEVVIHQERFGYDGLPVTQLTRPAIRSAEVEYQEGYDGLPLVDIKSRGLLAIQD